MLPRRPLSCLLVLLAALMLLAGAPAGASDWPPVQDLAAQIELLEDPTQQLDIDQVRATPAASGFQPLRRASASFGLSDSAWWLRLQIVHPGARPQAAVLRQDYPLLDHLEVWVFEGETLRQHWRSGDRERFDARPIEHRDFLFPLQLPPRATLTVYVRAQSAGPVNVPLTLYTPEALLTQIGHEQLALGALFGSFFLLATCILLLWLFVRDRAFLYYLAYILSYGSYMAVFNGIAYQYVFPRSPEIAGHAQVLLLMAALFFLLQFSRSLLMIPGLAPRLDRGNRMLQLLLVGIALGSPVFSYADLMLPISLATVGCTLMVMAMGIASLLAGQATARYFLLAWSAFLIGVMLYMAKSFGWLAHGFITQYGFQIGTLFEIVLLSATLGIRVKEIKQQSLTDALTGLGNRARFDALFEARFAARGKGRAALALLILDIDHFKRINDSHGHAIGDRVLQRVAEALRRSLRPNQIACRFGGEEFTVLLPDCDDAAARALAEQLRQAIADDRREPAVTISIGVASTAAAHFASSRELFRAADEALYAAKRSGRNRVVADTAPTPANALGA